MKIEDIKDIETQRERYYTLYFRIMTSYSKLYQRIGLSAKEADFLWIIGRSDKPLTQTDLRDITGYYKQSVHSTVKVLIEKGFLRLKSHSDDGRAKRIELTAKGKKAFEEDLSKIVRTDDAALAAMPEGHADQMLETLEEFVDNLEKEASR